MHICLLGGSPLDFSNKKHPHVGPQKKILPLMYMAYTFTMRTRIILCTSNATCSCPPFNMLPSCLHPRGSKSAGHAFCPYHFATENNAVLSINAGIYARLAKVRPSVRISSNMLMYITYVYVCECVQIVNVLICVLLIKSHVTM